VEVCRLKIMLVSKEGRKGEGGDSSIRVREIGIKREKEGRNRIRFSFEGRGEFHAEKKKKSDRSEGDGVDGNLLKSHSHTRPAALQG